MTCGPVGVLRGLAALTLMVLLMGAAAIADLAPTFGVAYDYGNFRASLLAGIPGGNYHALASRLALRAERERGRLTVVPTAGSAENVSRLAGARERCTAQLALV